MYCIYFSHFYKSWHIIRIQSRGERIIKKHISQIYYNMNVGITEPKYALLDDGTQVVVKLSHGPEGNLVLFNEYVCYRMAILVDIPMPYSGICIMDENTEVFDSNIASNMNYGYAFYSTYMPKTTKLLPTIINFMKNKNIFIKVLLFDHIIFNSDRNEGNLLVCFYKDDISLKVIDHTHVFINGAIWELNCLKRAIDGNDLFSTKVLEYNERLYNMFYRNMKITKEDLEQASLVFKNKINCDIIKKFIEECPQEWRPTIENEDMLVEYLMYRIDHLDVIISTIMSYLN